jgi:hypothetical protein
MPGDYTISNAKEDAMARFALQRMALWTTIRLLLTRILPFTLKASRGG